MDVIFKLIITGIIVAFTLYAVAGQNPQFKDTENEKILQYTYLKLQKLTDTLESKVKSCAIARKNRVLPKSIFKDLALTEAERRTSLLYFSRLAEDNCAGKELLGEVVIVLAQFKELEKRYRSANTIETKYDLETLCCLGWESNAKVEIAYRKIAPDIRQILESNAELQKPFNPISTADNLGL